MQDFDINIVISMLRDGHCDGSVAYVIRNAVPAGDCRTVYTNFKRIISEHGSQRAFDDIIKANQIGSTQFQKSGQAYAMSTARAQPLMLALFDNLSPDQASQFMLDNQLQASFLKHGLHFGPARFKSTYANYCTIRAWLDNGEMALHPHEDISQVQAARTDDFEIQAVETAMSFNVCIARSGSGGGTTVWDLQPSPEARRSLGLYDTGYPYPVDFVGGLPSFTLTLNPGDCYFLGASFLHGVQPTFGERVTAGRFMGLTKDNRVLFWT
ncbi:2OG-Fe(II)-dependent halogenase WelO5 family protein [Streptomyces lincolnensis]|uniref:2OG-Fe(II)-dependent halogenase WelO5 family protein n=1 Tax=Streptomyces lincolnensis TaxID=1915 RepID=UPI0037D80AA7